MGTRSRAQVGTVAFAVVLLLAFAGAATTARTTPVAPLVRGEAGVRAAAVQPVPVVPDGRAEEGLAVPVADAPPPPTAPLPPVESRRVAVAVTTTAAEEAGARAAVDGLDGVQHVAAVTVLPTALGGVQAEVAAVDVATFRPFTPASTAASQPLWDRIAAGDVAVTHEFGTVHEVPLGSTLATEVQLPTGQAQVLRVGAFATNGTPPVADAIVDASVLPADAPGAARRLLVALDPAASPDAAVDVLTAAGLDAEVVPDPRAPRSEAVVPRGDITPENVWDHLAMCESSGDWQINTGNGYYGGVQFLPESWWMVGGQGLPHEHTREEQIYRATLLWQIQGWEAWPQCARKLGLIVDPPEPTEEPEPTPVRTEPA